MDFPGLDPDSLASTLAGLLTAWVLALPVAWNREHGQQLGLRTLPLVAVASYGYVLMGIQIAGDDANALSRIVQGLITGIGFIGGGAILKSADGVQGTATAAAIWAIGAVGAAVATARFELAVAITTVTFLTFLVLTPLGRRRMDDDVAG